MSLFDSMMSVNFRVDEKGETTFYFPVFGGVWCARKGRRITSDEDIKKLKKYLRIHIGIVGFGMVPLSAVIAMQFLELIGMTVLWFLLSVSFVVFVYTLTIERVFIRGIVEKYEQSEEKPKFTEFQGVQAESYSWNALVLLAIVNVIFLALGLFVVLSGFAVGTGIAFVVIFALTGAQLAHLIALKRRGGDADDRE